jgi:hypothetical protein
MLIGYAPVLAVVLVYFARYDLEALTETDFFIWFSLGGILAFGLFCLG